MTDLFFVDTNVHVYRLDANQPRKQEAADRWLRALWRNHAGRASVQVLNELYVVTQRLAPPLPRPTARLAVRSLFAWRPIPVHRRLVTDAWDLQDRHSLSFWDATIVAAARAVRCRYLLTEDLQDGQEIAGVRVVDPFVHLPDELGLAQ